ncbi:metallophosphoesterase family protein [Reichenbachiella sp.]|uniref:metallophosphoesterase family protein n=1 Tax=Reichenbachiella sp. TaxID=2184521 RepID=UPI003BB1BF7D
MSADNISILLLSDTHIGFDHPLTNKPSKKRRRGFDFLNNFKLVVNRALELKVDYVIHCGDVFEKASVPTFLVDQTYAEFLRLANAEIQILIVPGNHERSALPPSLFLNHPNIHIFDVARTYSFAKLSISGFPYYKGDIRSKFPSIRTKLGKNVSKSDFNILCVHHAIDGVKAGHHFFEFRNRKDTLNIKDLPGDFDIVLSGHIHKHQILEAPSKAGKNVPIIYSGSTEKTMFDEINETKGYHILNIECKTFTHEFLPLRTRPMYQIDLRNISLTIEQLAEFLSIRMKTFESDAIVQINSDEKDILYELSKLKTKGFFNDSMNITLSGFSSLHRRGQD